MDLTGALLLSAIGILIGFLIGALVFYLRRSDSTSATLPKRTISKSRRELRFWREGQDKQLVVEIDGASYRRGDDLNKEQNRRLTRLQADLQTWLKDFSPELVQPASTQAEPSQPKIEEPDDEAQRTSLNPFHIFTRTLQPYEKSGEDEPGKSIVEQIDDILQMKLQGTHLEERGIKLLEGPDQAMVIEVGLDRYSDIDSIPDDAVRQVIRVSVAEWENRTAE
jgi:hypothetical protein